MTDSIEPSPRITLTAQEIDEINKPVGGKGGFQAFLARLRSHIEGNELVLTVDLASALLRYIDNYGTGGFQSRLRQLDTVIERSRQLFEEANAAEKEVAAENVEPEQLEMAGLYSGLSTSGSGIKIESPSAEVEARYDSGQARIVTQRNDFLIPSLLQMLRDGDVINVSPVYQRRYRWSNRKRSLLIESLLMNIPIPPIFLYEHDLAKYEVMDGQQRISSIRSFFDGEFPLSDLQVWPELNSYHYSDLPPRLQAGLQRRALSAIIVLTESGSSPEEAMRLRQHVFERLNTGGEPLNPQEVRNCIYAGHFNDMLVRIARSDLFTAIWNIPSCEDGELDHASQFLLNNRLYSTMTDCEIVLRYFALDDLAGFRGMKRTLDDCMLRMRKTAKAECRRLEAEYQEVLLLAYRIFGESLFKLPARAGRAKPRYSIPFSDAVMLGLKPFRRSDESLLNARESIMSRTRDLLADEGTYEVMVGRANTKSDIENRIRLMRALFEEHV